MSLNPNQNGLTRGLILVCALPSLMMTGCSAPMAFGGSNTSLLPPGSDDPIGSGQGRQAGRQLVKFNPNVTRGMEIVPVAPWGLRVEPGTCTVNGKPVPIAKPVLVTETAPPPVSVKSEPVKFVDSSPQGKESGTLLRGTLIDNTPVPGALDTTSIKVWNGVGSDRTALHEDMDYLLNAQTGQLTRKPGGAIPADGTVYVDYQVRQIRLDTIEVKPDGSIELKKGEAVLTAQVPAAVDANALPLATVFLDYGDTHVTSDSVFPIGAPLQEPSETERTAMLASVSHTRAKLLAGDPVTIVFWGQDVDPGKVITPAPSPRAADNVSSEDPSAAAKEPAADDSKARVSTAAFKEPAGPKDTTTTPPATPSEDASSESKGITPSGSPLAAVLVREFKGAKVTSINVGSHTSTIEDRLPSLDKDVLSHHPDLVIIESAADMALAGPLVKKDYTDAVQRIKAAGGEVLLTTPYMTATGRPHLQDIRKGDSRTNVDIIRGVAHAEGVGLADVSRRWEHLAAEGIPFTALLANGRDLPDSRGLQTYVDTLERFF